MSVRRQVIRALLLLAGRWWSPVLVITVWLWWIWVGQVPRVVAPPPTEVAFELAHPAWVLDGLLSTVWLTLLGGVLGLTAGTLLAVACWWFSLARPVIMTPAIVSQMVPVVVFIPILGRVVGFGTSSVLAIAVLSGFFPSLVFVDSGLLSVPRAREDLARLLGASRFSYLRHVALPSSVPRLAVAVRLTAASAFLGTVTADYLVGSDGLGRLMADTQFFLRTSRSWAIAALVIALSVGAFSAAGRLERWTNERFEIGGM